MSADDLQEDIVAFDNSNGRPINLFDKLASCHPQMAIAAEFKRASPSKGDINVQVDVVTQCLQYADMGASVISVLTEFKHFKGMCDCRSNFFCR